MKKALSLILALLMLAGILISCGSVATQTPEKESTPAVTQTAADEETKTVKTEEPTAEESATEEQSPEESTTEEPTTEEEIEGDPAPDFTVKLTNGETFTLSDYKDKVVFLNFWASWCGPCVGELPDIQKMYDDNMKDVVIIAVNYAESRGTVTNFVRKNNYTFNVGIDQQGKVSDLYPTDGIPYTLIINKGKIVKTYLGAPNNAYYEYRKAILACFKK